MNLKQKIAGIWGYPAPEKREWFAEQVIDLLGPSIVAIAEERLRQVEEEEWTPEHDQAHYGGEIGLAAAVYAAGNKDIYCGEEYYGGSKFTSVWPWDPSWDKRDKHPRQRQLAIAGALCAAEMDRLAAEEKITLKKVTSDELKDALLTFEKHFGESEMRDQMGEDWNNIVNVLKRLKQ